MPTVRMQAAVSADQSVEPTWVSLARFCRETGLSDYQARTLAVAGKVRTQTPEVGFPQYNLPDGLALVRQAS